MDHGQGRDWLLAANAGAWHGWFMRCAADGRELTRFPSRLLVQDIDGELRADLTNGRTGEVRSMAFRQPPPAMQIMAAGHWSLGPERISPYPWQAELCLVHGQRRRRVVFSHGGQGLDWFVLVVEARPGLVEPVPAEPLWAPSPGSGRWCPEPGVELFITSAYSLGEPLAMGLRWTPEPGVTLEIKRRYGASGLLESLPAALQSVGT